MGELSHKRRRQVVMALLVFGGTAASVSTLVSSRLKWHDRNADVDVSAEKLATPPRSSDRVMREEAKAHDLERIALASLRLGMTVAEVDQTLAAIGLSPGNTQFMGGEFHTSYECQDTKRQYLRVSFGADASGPDASFEEDEDVKLRVTKLKTLEPPNPMNASHQR